MDAATRTYPLSGRDLLLKVDAGGGFRACAGLRLKSLQLDARTVDVTDSDSAGWRELLPGAGLRTAELSGAGVFRSAASDHTVRTAFFQQAALPCRFILPGFGTVEGPFLVSRLRYSGRYNGEASFEMSFQSAGPLQWEALSGASPSGDSPSGEPLP